MHAYRFRDFIGKKVLITGDVGTGKTALTARLLQEGVKEGFGRNITVLDMAPRKGPHRTFGAGGRLRDFFHPPPDVRYLTSDKIRAPRLEGGAREEALRYARENCIVVKGLFGEFLQEPTSILFINDLSIYLHAGELDTLNRVLSQSETVVANAYEGSALKEDLGSGISTREAELVRKLKESIGVVIELTR